MVVRQATALILLGGLITLWALGWQAPSTSAQAACQFSPAFAALRDLVGPDTVGNCLEDEHVNAESGDVEQRTTGGLLVLRQADTLALFTDGVTSWVDGPNGLQSRPSGDRFGWESEPAPPAQAVPASDEAGTASSPSSNTTASSPPSSSIANVPSLFVLGPPQAASTGAGGAPGGGAGDAPAPAPPPAAPTATSVPPPTATSAPASAATPMRPAAPGPTATSISTSTSTSASASTAGRTSPTDGQCPSTHQIKGVTSSNGQKLFYEPDRPDYAKATPDACFTAGGDARDAGYVSSKR